MHLLFWISLRTHWLCPLFNDTMHRFGPGADFFALYQAGYNALHHLSIYQFPRDHTVVPYGYPFRYLPAAAYSVGILMTLFRPTVTYALWLGLCELLLLQNVRLTYTRAGGGVRGAGLAATWLMFMPFFLELWVGQFTFVLASLAFWCVLAKEEGREGSARGWWIASVLWKPATLLWLPLWLRERRSWPALGAGALLLAANGLYFAFFPRDWRVFVDTNLHPLPSWHAGNVGLTGLIYQFTQGGPAFLPVRGLLTVLLLAPLLWVTFRTGRENRPAPFWLLAGLWTTLYFLIYKDVWEHHLNLLLPFLVLGLWHARTRTLMAITLLLALPSPFYFYDVRRIGFSFDPQPYFSPGVSLLHHAWRVVPLVALYVHWLVQAWPSTGVPPRESRAERRRRERIQRRSSGATQTTPAR